MANPIQKSDLISDEALKALEDMSRLLREDKENMDALMASFKQYAGSIQTATTANSGNNDALAAALQKVSELEKAYSELKKAMKENTETQKRVNEEKRKYKKLTDDEIRAVEDLRSALAGTAQEQINAVKNINIQNKSYNELNATYNALKDSLNKLTTAERQNTEAGKAMTEQARNIRDTMNQLQQATGNYTLNVGNYASAFNGLRFQTQQILREIPSAINVQQFFLAISNNVPMFAEALSRYNQALPEMKVKMASITAEIAKQEAEMAGMNALTTEYASKQAYVNTLKKQEIELQALAQGGWKAILKSVVSWQTLLIAGLLLLRKIPDLIEKISERMKSAANEAKRFEVAVSEVQIKTLEGYEEERTKLGFLLDALNDATQGSVRFADITKEIGEIIHQNIDPTAQDAAAIRDLAQAYMELSEQQVRNKIVEQMVSTSRINRQKRELATQALSEGDFDKAAVIMGWTGEEAKKQRKNYEKARGNDKLSQFYAWLFRNNVDRTRTAPLMVTRSYGGASDLTEAIESATPFLTTEDEKNLERELWDFIKSFTNNNGRGAKKPSEKDVTDKYWETEKALLSAKFEGYELERQLAKLNRDKERDELINWYVDQKLALDENLKNNKISQERYDAEIIELDRENAALRVDINLKYWNKINKINREEAERALKAREDRTIREINAITNVELKASTKRVRNTAQETAKNNVLVENLNRLLNARKELIALDIASDETRSIEERTKALEKLNKEISKYASQLDFSKRLGNYSSLSDMITKNIDVSAGGKKSVLKNIIGEDAMKAAAEALGEGFEDWVDGQFETWMNSATKAVSTWYSTTMGYINDLISAYVDLANAKAEAAKEATEAAQEEYDKEKALLEAGYASRVEATWAEYQEKKAAQEKAEADAKAAAQAQKELNEISTASNMIVAASNIWKTFSAMGPVGVAAAVAAITAMFGAFVQSKIKANEVSKYGEGGFEVLEGGSHASGHDIDLGVRNRRGRRMKAEGKEGIGIFSVRAMNHYGDRNIEGFVNSINRLEFEGNAAKRMSLERSVGMAVLSAPRTDLRRVESGIDKIVSLGSRSRTVNADGSVTEYRNNGKVTIKKG